MSTTINKFFTLALVLWIAGVAGFGWVLLERRKEKQLVHQQQETLNSQFIKLDKLLSGEIGAQSFGADAAEKSYEEELGKCRARKITIRPLVVTASTSCMAVGAIPFACWLLLSIARCTTAGLSRLKKFLVGLFRKPNALVSNELQLDDSDKETERIKVLYCDEKSLDSKEQVKFDDSDTGVNVELLEQLEQNIRKTVSSNYHQSALKVPKSLKAQKENLEKQVTEFRQTAQTVKEVSVGHSEPIKSTLAELTQQVSAIREYASYQQDRIEKLQEGYDWNIIRTFCLRVIRCIDNLENRIARLSKQDVDTTDLEEIMDELVFALESSGVEQFKPKVNSNYSGQERGAEVVKGKIHPKSPKMKGKIAEVVKPGYQYMIDDGNIKIVRTARVKLFG